MADIERDIVLRVKSETEQAQGEFKNLKQELRSIETQLNQMAEAGDTGSQAFRQLQQRAGQVKDQIGDTKQAIKALSSDTFKLDAFAEGARGIAGGFASAQGAMALFGSENKAVEEAIMRTQGAMALLQGVTEITNTLQKESAFSQFFLAKAQTANTVATEGATVATKGFSRALIATGIGAIIVLIGTLVAYWDDLKSAVTGVSLETEKYIETAKADTEEAKKKYELTKETENVLKLQGKSQREILNIRIKETEAIVHGIKTQIEGQKLATKQAIDGAIRNQEIAQKIIMAITWPFKLIAQQIDKTINGLIEAANFFGAGIDFKLNLASYDELLAKTIFDPEEIKAKGLKSEEELQKELNKIVNEQAGFKLEIQKLNEEDAKKAKELQEKEPERLKKIRDEREKLTKGMKDLQIETKSFTNTLNEQSDEAHKRSMNDLKVYNEAFKKGIEDRKKGLENEKKTEAELFKTRRDQIFGWVQVTQDSLDLLGSIHQIYASKDEKAQKEAFEKDKKFKVASAITATAMGVAQQLAVPKDQLTGLNFAKAALVLATGLVQIKKIQETKFESKSPPSNNISGNVSLQPSDNATNTPGINSTMLNLDAQGNLKQGPMRTYVVESDISNKQKRSRQLSQTAILK